MAVRENGARNGSIPWWVPGDWDAFFGLGTNSILNILVLSGLLLDVVNLPRALVFGRIIPAVGVMLVISNVYYAFMARRLALRTGRTDVTAMPAGPSVPHMFIVVLLIMLPVYLRTGDPILAWQAGLAWNFIEGSVEVVGAFIAPAIKRITPRAALLGTLAGISIAFISMRPAQQIWTTPWVGLVSLAIVIGGWMAGVRFPFRAPAGLLAIVVGSLIGWISGIMNPAALGETLRQLDVGLPRPAINEVFAGFADVAPLLVTAIPFGIYDFMEAMNNVESANAAGDEYSVKDVLLVDGIGSLVGTLLGSPFPNAVYIGQPGWKKVGGRIGYSLATGVLVAVVSILGIIPLLLEIIPLVAVLPILLYIGALIGAQAFQVTPSAHASAIVLAFLPHLAAWAQGLIDSALTAAGTTAADVGIAALDQAGVLYDGLAVLGGGAIVGGMILAAITVFMIERQFRSAAASALAGAVLSFFGFVHGQRIGWAQSPTVALGYLLMAVLLFGFSFLPHPEVEEEREGAAAAEAAMAEMA
jgi:AGZA family xanthine/uracil permease-like MFS transporter